MIFRRFNLMNIIGGWALYDAIRTIFSRHPKPHRSPTHGLPWTDVHPYEPEPYTVDASSLLDDIDSMHSSVESLSAGIDTDELESRLNDLETRLNDSDITAGQYDACRERIDMLRDRIEELEAVAAEIDDPDDLDLFDRQQKLNDMVDDYDTTFGHSDAFGFSVADDDLLSGHSDDPFGPNDFNFNDDLNDDFDDDFDDDF